MGESGQRQGTRTITYCVVPQELAGRLHEHLRDHFRATDVEVVVERRAGDERRTRAERRAEPVSERRPDRRVVRNVTGRRVLERRTLTVPTSAEIPLPAKARRYADRLAFVERLEPSDQHLRDADSKRLVLQYQAGDEDAFGELYLRYFNPVYTYVKVALGDHHEAEDVTQQVFMRILAALGRYELRQGVPVRGWIFSIARNTMLTAVKKRHGLRYEPPDELDFRREENAPQSPDSLEVSETLGWLSDREIALFVDRLPEAQRQVLVLRYMLELTGEEIAQVLGRSHLAVRQLQTRALRHLESRLSAIGRTSPRRDRTRMRMRLKPMPVMVRRRFALGVSPRGVSR